MTPETATILAESVEYFGLCIFWAVVVGMVIHGIIKSWE